jgi:5'-AMP-activated protein kinase, catalytic alpha subunit
MVMELANGGELIEYINQHSINETQARLFFTQIIAGV